MFDMKMPFQLIEKCLIVNSAQFVLSMMFIYLFVCPFCFALLCCCWFFCCCSSLFYFCLILRIELKLICQD